jgi:hypothetical protein
MENGKFGYPMPDEALGRHECMPPRSGFLPPLSCESQIDKSRQERRVQWAERSEIHEELLNRAHQVEPQ